MNLVLLHAPLRDILSLTSEEATEIAEAFGF
jgi:hypothetical protein